MFAMWAQRADQGRGDQRRHAPFISANGPARHPCPLATGLYRNRAKSPRKALRPFRYRLLFHQVMRTIIDGDLSWDKFRHVSRSEEHTSELQSLMRNSYAVFYKQLQIVTQNV